MLVLGVDPGLTRCGFGLVRGEGRRLSLVAYEVARTGADEPVARRLLRIGDRFRELLDHHAPDAVALERVFAQQNLSTVMGVAQISGIVLSEAARRDIPIEMYTPTQVKSTVTGYGAADKRQVGTMVARLLGLAEAPSPADAADAVALAISHHWLAGRSAGAGAASGEPTPAQKAWRAAEASTRKRGAGPTLRR